jgi:non-heme chloroperoxidase
MPYFEADDRRFWYEDRGEGRPLIFLHGVWMSSRFFHKQLESLSTDRRVIALDFRGHGRSGPADGGHTVPTYARDLHTLVESLGLPPFVLAGWSMGAMVVWEYLRQWGAAGVQGTIVIDQSASDYAWADWPLGVVGFDGLCRVMTGMQETRAATCRSFAAAMFKRPPDPGELEWIVQEMLRLPASEAAAIFFDQTVQDYRAFLPAVSLPTLLCFGRDGKMMPVEAGEHLHSTLPLSRLTVFENSGHCPFLEEPETFDRAVRDFLANLD